MTIGDSNPQPLDESLVQQWIAGVLDVFNAAPDRGGDTFLTDTPGSGSRKLLTAQRARVSNSNRSVGMTMVAARNESPPAVGWYRPKPLEDGGRDRQAGVGGG